MPTTGRRSRRSPGWPRRPRAAGDPDRTRAPAARGRPARARRQRPARRRRAPRGRSTAEHAARRARPGRRRRVHVDRGVFRPLALADGLPADVRRALERGSPWAAGGCTTCGARRAAVRRGRRGGHRPTVPCAGHPRGRLRARPDSDGETVALIEAGSFVEPRAWSAADRRLIETVASTLGAVLARVTVREREAELLEVVRQLARATRPASSTNGASTRPSASCPARRPRRCSCRPRWRLRLRRRGRLRPRGAAPGTADRGRPARLVRRRRAGYRRGCPPAWTSRSPPRAAGGAHGGVLADGGPDAAQIRASLCVPIALQDEVMAILNVDAFSRDEAFGLRAIALAQALGDHVAVIVRQAHDREALARSALTDPLTGLGNREAFNRTLSRELQRTRRYGEPVALAMLDLNGFKVVNDTLGHAAGDRALVAVAAAPRACAPATRPFAGAATSSPSSCRRSRRRPVPRRPSASSAPSLPSRSTAFSCARASASPTHPTTATTPTRCCAGPTTSCTRSRARAGPR